jgi:hypothetical protein
VPKALTTAVPVLLLASAAAAPAQAAEPAAPDVKLPTMTSQLANGSPCRTASSNVASAEPWEQQQLDLSDVWQLSSAGGSGVKVAVVDTGVSAHAPALAGRVSTVGAAGTDCVGHGSFVAGLIAAAPANGVHFAGVAQHARIIGVRGTDSRGAATAASIASGIRAAVQSGADVIDVSPAVTSGSAELTAAVAEAVRKDALIVAAAVPDATGDGTGGSPGSSSVSKPRDYYPAALPGVLSVMDTDATSQHPSDALAPRHADLSAPGDGVISIGPGGAGHFIGSGASLAAGYVAGTAALVRAQNPHLDAAQAAQQLTASAYPADVPQLDPYASLVSVRDTVSDSAGHGRAGAAAAAAPVHLPSGQNGARATRRSLVLAGVSGGLVLLTAAAVAVVPLGRRRRWRPAGRPVPPAPPEPSTR